MDIRSREDAVARDDRESQRQLEVREAAGITVISAGARVPLLPVEESPFFWPLTRVLLNPDRHCQDGMNLVRSLIRVVGTVETGHADGNHHGVVPLTVVVDRVVRCGRANEVRVYKRLHETASSAGPIRWADIAKIIVGFTAQRSPELICSAPVVVGEVVNSLVRGKFNMDAAMGHVRAAMVILKLRVRVIEFVSYAFHVPRIIVVDRVIPKIAKIFPPSRSTIHDHIVRKVNSCWIAHAVVKTSKRPDRTRGTVVDVRPGAREVRDTLTAEIAGASRAARPPLISVNVITAPAPFGALTVVVIKVPLVRVLEAEAERKWVRSASGPGSDQSARRPARTVGVARARPAVGGAPSSHRKAKARAVAVVLA